MTIQWKRNSSEWSFNSYPIAYSTALYALIHVHHNASIYNFDNFYGLALPVDFSQTHMDLELTKYWINRFDQNTKNGGNMISIGR